ncbi:hypothetical protein CsSME_00011292 [Camellia sinensis var. sinensis]|uniref:Protein MAINTENANCE OF PSII UNDER HIGH LIGHT 1 n=1 Tax=Camellia sinensis var. sinensis TaxID=542762 RepID=A0A4S4EZG0_CAMSN|nr:protein MAINTENANCE OF PSII UNDER HIGH LIGHT 1 [Camellia sinensis]THG21886.1 hypothetical protein TEA_023566 [Camellia sinensis var. sinensis]
MVGSGSQAVMLSANSGASLVTSSRPSRLLFLFFNNNNNNRYPFRFKKSSILRPLRASSDEPDCNVEECAPDKEVGKVSVEWLAEEKTKVLGTFPPRNRGWTGYVEKDTAGQTNIYSVEPAVYVAESAISSGTAGSSADGSEKAKAIVTGLALVSVAAAASILLQVGKISPPQIQTAEYSGPSLTYYINKFKPQEIIQAQAQTETEISESNALQVSKVELES